MITFSCQRHAPWLDDELVRNNKTAKTLGLNVPMWLLMQIDEVIE